jgi:O-antigen ligase
MEKAMLATLASRVITFKESIVHTSPLVLGLGASILVAIASEQNISFFARIFCLSSAGLLILSSFLLLSRALSAAVIIGVIATLLASGVRRRYVWPLILIPLFSLFLWLILPEDLTVRFERAWLNMQLGTGTFTTQRLEVAWPDAVETILEHPLLGIGYGAYKQVARLAPHNQLLDIWVQVGIGGVILFLWTYTSFVRVTWRTRHDDDLRVRAIANGLFGQFMGCAVALQFNDSFFYPWLSYALFFTAVLLDPGARGMLDYRGKSWLEEPSSTSV